VFDNRCRCVYKLLFCECLCILRQKTTLYNIIFQHFCDNVCIVRCAGCVLLSNGEGRSNSEVSLSVEAAVWRRLVVSFENSSVRRNRDLRRWIWTQSTGTWPAIHGVGQESLTHFGDIQCDTWRLTVLLQVYWRQRHWKNTLLLPHRWRSVKTTNGSQRLYMTLLSFLTSDLYFFSLTSSPFQR